MHLNLFTTIRLCDSNNNLLLSHKINFAWQRSQISLHTFSSTVWHAVQKKGRRRKRPFGSLQKDVKTEHIHVSIFSSVYIMVQTLKTGRTKKKQGQVSTQTFCRC